MIEIRDELVIKFETYLDGCIEVYATARPDGRVYQGGLYYVTNGTKSEVQWVTWGSNPQKAMRNAARKCRIDRQGDDLVIAVR